MTEKVRTVRYWVIFGLFVAVWIVGFTLLTVCWHIFDAEFEISGVMMFSAVFMGFGVLCAISLQQKVFDWLFERLFSKMRTPEKGTVPKETVYRNIRLLTQVLAIVADVFLAIIAIIWYFKLHPTAAANVDWDLVQTIVFPILYIIAMLIIYRICKSMDSVLPEQLAHRFDLRAFRWLFPHDRSNFGTTISNVTFLFELWNLLFSVGCVATVIVLGLCVGGTILSLVGMILFIVRMCGIIVVVCAKDRYEKLAKHFREQ